MMSVAPTPTVSIVMAMRNSAQTITAALRSLQLQTLSDWELLLIDDGSTDESMRIAQSFNNDRIRLYSDGQHLGLAARLNEAVALSRADIIARMDADDICFPERLARQVARLKQDSALDLLGCGAVVFTDAGAAVGVLPIASEHEKITARPFEGFALPHPTWCGRARWFRDNPYDAKLMKTQDQDLLLRTFAKSRFGAIDEVLLGYRQDKPDLRKMLKGRRVFAGSIWRHACVTGDYGQAGVGIGKHGAKAAIDIVASACGLTRYTQRNRFKPVPLPVAGQWADLWQQLHNERSIDPCAE